MKHTRAKSVLSLAAGVGLFSIPSFAKADHFGFGVRVDERRVEHVAPRRWVEPIYEERQTQVWVEPVYRTESAPVFVAEYYETKCERVWREPVYEVREVVRYERGRRVCVRERVCVRPGGYDTVERRVLVPAHYRHEERQCLVTPGHYEAKCEKVCAREGHWEGREVIVEHPRHERDRVSVGFDIRGRF